MVSGGVFNIEEGINAHIKHAHFTRLPPANFHSIWQHVPKTLPAIHAETGQRNHRISPKLGTVWHIVSQYDPICTLYRLYMCNISYICDWACHVICIDLPSSKLSPLAVAIQWATISPKLGFLQWTLRLAQLAGPGFASFPSKTQAVVGWHVWRDTKQNETTGSCRTLWFRGIRTTAQ